VTIFVVVPAKVFVVPAKAGTHNHRHRLLREQATATAHIDGPRRMGPRFRTDHERMVLREGNK